MLLGSPADNREVGLCADRETTRSRHCIQGVPHGVPLTYVGKVWRHDDLGARRPAKLNVINHLARKGVVIFFVCAATRPQMSGAYFLNWKGEQHADEA